MISQLELRLFKCFALLRLPLAPLTLLTGPNASGKSSVLQALVLLHQTMREHEWSTRVALNGAGVRLGAMPDVVDEVFGRDSFDITVSDEANVCAWSLLGDRRDMSMEVRSVSVNGRVTENPQELRYLVPSAEAEGVASLTLKLRNLTYITAERIAPQETYELEDPHTIRTVGPRGEHAASVLHWARDEPLLEELIIPEALPPLLRQVEARMSTLFPGCTLDLQESPRANSRHAGPAHIGRRKVPPPSPHWIRTHSNLAYRGSCTNCSQRRHHPDREPGSTLASGHSVTDGTAPSRCRARRDPGDR